jgi:hypothetical protein
MATATLSPRVGFVLAGIHRLVRLAFRMVGRGGRTMLSAVPRPPSPVTEPWEVSIGTLVCAHPKVPSIVGRLLRRFDKFGRVSIAPDRVGFDNKTIKWSRVIEIRSYPTKNLVPDIVLDREIDRVREMFPPTPGRRWMLMKVAHVVSPVVMSFTRRPRWPAATAPMIPCEIVYRSVLGRQAILPAGVFAAVMLGAIPEASNSLITTARARAIPVRTAPDAAGAPRAARAERVF